MPTPFEPLEAGATIRRFVPLHDAYIPPGARLPTNKAFEPSTGDEDEARERGRPVMVSVWDKQFTTVAQARAIRGEAKAGQPFELTVKDVIQIASDLAKPRLKVLADPLPSEHREGADGHCGIEGCDRLSGAAKREHKDMLNRLATACSPVAEDD